MRPLLDRNRNRDAARAYRKNQLKSGLVQISPWVRVETSVALDAAAQAGGVARGEVIDSLVRRTLLRKNAR